MRTQRAEVRSQGLESSFVIDEGGQDGHTPYHQPDVDFEESIFGCKSSVANSLL